MPTACARRSPVRSGVYLAQHRIPFSEEAFNEESSSEIKELSKNALFYGAEVFPDAP